MKNTDYIFLVMTYAKNKPVFFIFHFSFFIYSCREPAPSLRGRAGGEASFTSSPSRTLRTPQSRVLQRVQDHSARRAVRCRDRYARSSR